MIFPLILMSSKIQTRGGPILPDDGKCVHQKNGQSPSIDPGNVNITQQLGISPGGTRNSGGMSISW